MALRAKVVACSWAPAIPGSRSELGDGAGAAAGGGLHWRGKISAVLPMGQLVVIQMEAERGPLCSGVVTGEWTPVDFLT